MFARACECKVLMKTEYCLRRGAKQRKIARKYLLRVNGMREYNKNLNGKWLIDYISSEPYESELEPKFFIAESGEAEMDADCVTEVDVPAYFEDMLGAFRSTPLHTKLNWNPLYTLQKYPQAGYCPDMALPNPVGCFMYQKKFTIDEEFAKVAAALKVGGVQNTLSAWINGVYLGKHEGYSSEFFMEIPQGALVKGDNVITFAVSNNRLKGYKQRPVSGLTSRAANECTGGIYGDVEIKFYPFGLRDFNISVAKDLSSFTVKTFGGDDCVKNIRVKDENGKTVFSSEISSGEKSITVPCAGFKRWSSDNPYLYTLIVSVGDYKINRKFGIRRLTATGTKLYLNGEPYYFRGICEHCYHPITVHPTRDKAYYGRVIRTLKSLGFNSIRFHTHVPMKEYAEAADEMGMVIEVETPNNTTYKEWREIVDQFSKYTSVCAFSSGNEMLIDEDYIEHLRLVAEYVHERSDALTSPMSAMRGIEYYDYGDCRVDEPFPHNPKRLAALGVFSDIYNSYSLGLTSYESVSGTAEVLDYRNAVYKKPILSHEICIQGTYADLSLKDRYKGSRIGETQFMSSVEEHLRDKGLLYKAPLYYRNSVEWQKLLRKHCFETVRRCETFAGYDFLGDIDTHWHTFGYCVGMMNEFYELKATETVDNVLRYNSAAVLLCDFNNGRNYTEGKSISLPIFISNYGEKLDKATLVLSVKSGGRAYVRKILRLGEIENGKISKLYNLDFKLPQINKPRKYILSVSLFGGNTDVNNEWEFYAFPKAKKTKIKDLTVFDGNANLDEIVEALNNGEKVLLFGKGPFKTASASFQLSVAGRTNGHLATVISDHPAMRDFPHDGYCGWQFAKMLETSAVILDGTDGEHEPIIDIASSYKNARREALLFEYAVNSGKLLVCSLNLNDDDPAAAWFKQSLIAYAESEEFAPKQTITLSKLRDVCGYGESIGGKNENAAQNKNDITM